MNDLTGFLGLAYPWVKAAHVTFVIFWMAGLFLLPRFYVYHQEATVGLARGSRLDRARGARPLDHPDAGDDRRVDPRADAGLQRRCVEPGLVPRQARCWSIALSGYQGWLGAYGKKLATGRAAAVRQGGADDQRDPRHRRGADRRAGDRPSFLNDFGAALRIALIDSRPRRDIPRITSGSRPVSQFAGDPFSQCGVLPLSGFRL